MELKTELTNTKIINNLTKLSWKDCEAEIFEHYTNGSLSFLEGLPEFTKLFIQINEQVKSEQIDTSYMVVDECPIWGEYTVLSLVDNRSMTYFDIRINISKESSECVAEVMDVQVDCTSIEGEFKSIQDILNVTFSKK
ncbi:hypothetical protein GHK52_05815 [Lactococcus garvieae]|nr:hypothetical protein [Lactococcus garvieae]